MKKYKWDEVTWWGWGERKRERGRENLKEKENLRERELEKKLEKDSVNPFKHW